jgi:Tfp pilus assembly protein PilV
MNNEFRIKVKEKAHNKYFVLHNSSLRGQSLFEVVVALAVSALIIVALVSVVSNSIQNSTFSKNKALAATYAQEATEWLRGQRDSDTAAFGSNVLTPIWCFQNLNWNTPGACTDDSKINGTPFIRQGTFVVDTSSGKTIVQTDVTVSWTDSQGLHQVTSATNFSDWRER